MAILMSGQEMTLSAQLGQLKTGQGGKGVLLSQLWCPDDLPSLRDRIEIESEQLPKAIEHFVQGACYQRGGLMKDPSSYWSI